jgi:hypothetical protein
VLPLLAQAAGVGQIGFSVPARHGVANGGQFRGERLAGRPAAQIAFRNTQKHGQLAQAEVGPLPAQVEGVG